jgi:hypothetical protein
VLYHEPPVSIDSAEGLGLLGDAGVEIGKALDPVSDLMPLMTAKGSDHGNIVQLPDGVDRFEAPVDVSRLPEFGEVLLVGINKHETV